MNRSGFTLAEILVTLGVVGVIASMTVPTLVQDTQDAQYRSAWKKTFAELSQATKMIQATYGDIDFTSFDTFRDDYGKVMQFTTKDAFGNIFPLRYTFYKTTSESGVSYSSGDTVASAILQNGSCMRFGSGDIRIDINCKKGPNMFGKDYFVVRIVKDNGYYQTIPSGSNNDGKTCVSGSSTVATSDGCSAVALYADAMP